MVCGAGWHGISMELGTQLLAHMQDSSVRAKLWKRQPPVLRQALARFQAGAIHGMAEGRPKRHLAALSKGGGRAAALMAAGRMIADMLTTQQVNFQTKTTIGNRLRTKQVP